MKVSRSTDSPWKQRLYFETAEFEIMMNELRKRAGDKCFAEGKGVDVDYVLLKGYGCDPDYVELPTNILGKTIFSSDGKVEVLISSQLAEQAETDNIARRRLRTTIAHEIGHISCHRGLFLKDESTLSLFGQDEAKGNTKENNILCRESSVDNYRYSGEWWEYQANQCMATLLLPKSLLMNYVTSQLKSFDIPDFDEAIKADCADQIIRNICDQFDVSFESMFYRLRELGFIPKPDQFRLALGK
ncbi:ImmA/IrrE family metallo-endopeptidase [Candidatus Babeliales bacterium]|nr:ImmA/IrrE family metallo-endopeptidase [Candidatus Babeliales bacterium]